MGDNCFTELRRRNVLRVVFVYLVAAWLILQVADLIVPILSLPEWSSKLIFLLLILGFPISLILAWAFEVTPEGLKKEKDVDRSQSITNQTGRKIDFVIIGSLALALAYSIYFKDPGSDAAGAAVPAEDGTHSIAVLPLVNMSSDPETDYFSDGLAEELLNLLSKVDALRVAARTVGDDALAGDLLGKVGIQIGNAIEQRHYVLAAQQSRAAYYALAGERIRALYTLQQAADNGFAVAHDLETPFFDELKNNPDFQLILRQVRDNQVAMKEKVLALDNLLPDANAA